MEVEFADDLLRELYVDANSGAGFSQGIVSAYRKRIQFIYAAKDERDFRNWRSLRFEKLKGGRAGQYSMRLNDQYRLVLELKGESHDKTVLVVEIVDYHQ